MSGEFVIRCSFCSEPVDPNSRYTYTRISAWDRPGKAGGSDVVLRERLAEFAHPQCIDRVRNGINPKQETFV